MAFENYGHLVTALLKSDPEFGSQNFFTKFCDLDCAPMKIGIAGSTPYVHPTFKPAITVLLNQALLAVHGASLETLAAMHMDTQQRWAIESDISGFYKKLVLLAKRVQCELHQLALLELCSNFGAAVFNASFDAVALDLSACLGLEAVLKTVPAGTRPSRSLTQDALDSNNTDHLRLLVEHGVLDTKALVAASDRVQSQIKPDTKTVFAELGGQIE